MSITVEPRGGAAQTCAAMRSDTASETVKVRRLRYVNVAGDGARARDGGNRKESGYADVSRSRKLH
jgi:hypothetical protein